MFAARLLIAIVLALLPHVVSAQTTLVRTPEQCDYSRIEYHCTSTTTTKEASNTWYNTAIHTRAGLAFGCPGAITQICRPYRYAALYGLDVFDPNPVWQLYYQTLTAGYQYWPAPTDWIPLYSFSENHHFVNELPGVLAIGFTVRFWLGATFIDCGVTQYHEVWRSTSSQSTTNFC
jgi:hypothetical protein